MSIFVNLTAPIDQLRGKITDTIETCREIGSNRYISENFLEHTNKGYIFNYSV